MDFLTFKSFISTEVLIIFYYMGALILPAAAWLLSRYLLKKYSLAETAYQAGHAVIQQSLSRKQKLFLAAFFGLSFIFMELLWRMMFEFLIAYMQMRDALIAL